MKRILAGLLALALLATPSFAQGPPSPPPVSVLAGQVSLSVSNVSARVAIPSAAVSARALTVYNSGANDAYIATGTVAIVATSGGTCAAGPSGPSCRVPAGSSISFYTSDAYLAAITAASTTTLVIYQGTGPVALHIYGAPNGAAPTGPAGGDLAGTYPNPTVTQASNGFAIPSGALTFSGNITGAGIFGTNGIKLKTASGTLSDTTSSGTVATNYNNLFGGNTLTATNATTLTNNYGSYYVAPVCSTNVTCTNNYALGADSSNIGGTAITTSGAINVAVGQTMTTPYASITTQLQLGAANPLFWTGRSVILAPADGTIRLTNNAQTSFGVLQFYSDTGLSRDSVLGALNVDLGNGSANDKTGTLNLAKVSAASGSASAPSYTFAADATTGMSYGGSGSIVFPLGGSATALVMNSSSGSPWISGNSGGQFVNFFANGDLGLTPHAGNKLYMGIGNSFFGIADAASPVAQTIGVQNVVAGTSNTAGAVTTIRNSAGTGTALGGNTIFQYAPHDTTHTVNTFTGSASPYTIGFTAGNITTYPIGTVMTVSGCTTATLNGTYTVTASSSGSVTATTSATGTGSPTTCLIVGNTSQNAYATALTINGDTAALTAAGNLQAANLTSVAAITAGATGNLLWNGRSLLNSPADGTVSAFFNDGSTYGSLKFASLITAGTAPVGSGTCTRGTQTGGLTAGSIVLTCTAQTLILTFTTTAPNGWMCEAIDQTTTADTMKQTANSTTTCTLTGTTAASDVVIYQARAY